MLTYNYDRLFERTFLEWVKLHVSEHPNRDHEAVDWLNSSLRRSDRVEIKKDVFSLIKLHGGIGQFHRDGDYGLNHVQPFKLWQPLPPLADNPYFEIPGQLLNKQTIFYPEDKRQPDERRSQREKMNSSYLQYEEEVWDVAAKLVQSAVEVQIIGYSMQEIDWFWFKDLFQRAKKCTRIVIRNRPETLHSLKGKMERLGKELNIHWQVECMSQDFFGLDLK